MLTLLQTANSCRYRNCEVFTLGMDGSDSSFSVPTSFLVLCSRVGNVMALLSELIELFIALLYSKWTFWSKKSTPSGPVFNLSQAVSKFPNKRKT